VNGSAHQRARILVVDDEERIRGILRKIIADEGHHVECVATHEQAMARLERADIDVVLCDLMLGETDGVALLRTIAGLGHRPATIAVTGLADPDVVRSALEAGAAAYVTKPFKACDIAIGLQQALRRLEDDAASEERSRQVQEELRYRADHDPLTGVFNRRRFTEELERHLRVAAGRCARGAVLVCDLDHFTVVNDSLGHDAGDAVLRRVADAIAGRLRATDLLGRLGGDEFGILLDGVTEAEAAAVAAGLQRVVADAGARPAIGVSVGIATFAAGDGFVGHDLLVAADTALYDAKDSGRGTCSTYSGPKTSSLTWIERIRRALDEDGLVLFSQPIIDLGSGRVAGEELLVRMRDDDGGVIPPGAFLPTAERFGFIQEIDDWMLRQGLRLARTGRPVNVNISALTMQDGRLVEPIDSAVASGVDPSLLTIEITETSPVSNLGAVCELAERLTALGCGLALDDFGTGYGALTYLKHLPIGTIKIDRDFVRDLATDRGDERIIQAIVEIARAAGQTTVAEGVEDAAALDRLRRSGVDRAQGFFLGRPGLVQRTPPRLARGAAARFGSRARPLAA
jgi:diguanylate cyclase (GGDEF)-like protein